MKWIYIILILISLILVSCSNQKPILNDSCKCPISQENSGEVIGNVNTQNISQIEETQLTILQHKINADNNIIGEVKNIGTIKATYVRIIIILYDSNGGIIDTTFVYTDPMDLDPGDTAPFKFPIDNKNKVSNYKLKITSL